MMTRSMPPIDMPKVTCMMWIRLSDRDVFTRGPRTIERLKPVFEYREELLLPYHLSERVIGVRDDVQIERRPVVERREKQIAKLDPQVIVLGEHEQHALARTPGRR